MSPNLSETMIVEEFWVYLIVVGFFESSLVPRC